MAKKPGKAGVESSEISFVSWIRQISIFSNWSRCLTSWTLRESPSAFHWRMRKADWLTGSGGSDMSLLVCNGPCRSCGGVVVQRLIIQLFLARAVAAASLVIPESFSRACEVRAWAIQFVSSWGGLSGSPRAGCYHDSESCRCWRCWGLSFDGELTGMRVCGRATVLRSAGVIAFPHENNQ